MPELPVQERDPKEISDLTELQQQAKVNTQELNQLRAKFNSEQDPQVKEAIENEIHKRRIRSGALIRRRTELQQNEERVRREKLDRERQELAASLNFPEFDKRRTDMLSQLHKLATDADEARKRARGPGQREEARKLAILSRWSFIAWEAIKKSVPLVPTADDMDLETDE